MAQSFQNPGVLGPAAVACVAAEPCPEIAAIAFVVALAAKITQVGMTVKTDGKAQAGSEPPGSPREQYCAAQMVSDNAKCTALPRGAQNRCYSSAINRYGACLGYKILPPLITW